MPFSTYFVIFSEMSEKIFCVCVCVCAHLAPLLTPKTAILGAEEHICVANLFKTIWHQNTLHCTKTFYCISCDFFPCSFWMLICQYSQT